MKEDVQKMHNEIETEETFAMHLLKEIQRSSKRNFIAFIVTLIALILTNLAWVIYESQWEYVEEETAQYIQDINNANDTNFTQNIN